MTRLTWSIFAVLLLAGCVGNHSLQMGQPCPCAPGWTCDTSTNTCFLPSADTGGMGGDAGAVAAGGSAGTVDAAGNGGDGATCTETATCSTPAGTVHPFSSVDEIYAAMAGAWQFCTDAADWHAVGAPADVIGIEFGPASTAPTAIGSTVGGDAYYLVQGPSGPVRGSGFDYQVTYDVSPEGGQLFQLNIHPAPNSGIGGNIRYSPCPTEVQLALWENSNTSVLVHF